MIHFSFIGHFFFCLIIIIITVILQMKVNHDIWLWFAIEGEGKKVQQAEHIRNICGSFLAHTESRKRFWDADIEILLMSWVLTGKMIQHKKEVAS